MWSSPEFLPDAQVVSLVSHPPEIKPGTPATIVASWFGPLIAVQLPDGDLHRWFAWFELAPANPGQYSSNLFQPGMQATVLNTEGHPPHIHPGETVKIVKIIPDAVFYDLMLEGVKYHRWLADFELADASVINGK